MKPTLLLEHHLHLTSLSIARAFREAYSAGNQPLADDLLTAYRCVRRHISVGVTGKRKGSVDAHAVMMGRKL